MESLEQEYRPQARSKQLSLGFQLPPKLPTFQGDRNKLGLALHNLIGNALKYTPPGGSVRVQVDYDDRELVVAVSDTGIGIPEADLPRVFDKFHRADDPRLAEIKGTGLGLALAREVIRLHGGDIDVESTLDQGSTFTLRLPLRAGKTTEAV
jgi:signal transduction histidine kinase